MSLKPRAPSKIRTRKASLACFSLRPLSQIQADCFNGLLCALLQLGHAVLRVMVSYLTATRQALQTPALCPCFRAPATTATNCPNTGIASNTQGFAPCTLLPMPPNSQSCFLLHFRLWLRDGSLRLPCKKKQQPLLPGGEPALISASNAAHGFPAIR